MFSFQLMTHVAFSINISNVLPLIKTFNNLISETLAGNNFAVVFDNGVVLFDVPPCAILIMTTSWLHNFSDFSLSYLVADILQLHLS